MYEIFERLMQNKGVSAYRVSKDTGIAQATLIDWKNGKYSPKLDKIQKIADYFSVSVDYLLTGADQKEKPLVNGDEELTDYLEELRSRPDKRMLFSVTKTATKAQIEAIVKMIEEMQGN